MGPKKLTTTPTTKPTSAPKAVPKKMPQKDGLARVAKSMSKRFIGG